MYPFMAFVLVVIVLVLIDDLGRKPPRRQLSRESMEALAGSHDQRLQIAHRSDASPTSGGFWFGLTLRKRLGTVRLSPLEPRTRARIMRTDVVLAPGDATDWIGVASSRRTRDLFEDDPTIPEVRVGDRLFQAAFRVRTRDALAASRIVGDALAGRLMRLHGICHDFPVRIELAGHRIAVEKWMRAATRANYVEAHEESLAILDLVLDALGVGTCGNRIAEPEAIVALIEDGSPARGAATCQVCGEDIVAEASLCPECGTPHHPDCWDYMDGCSTFGCSGGSRS